MLDSSDTALDLSEAIKRYHDDLNLPPSVSLFLPIFTKLKLALTSEDLVVSLRIVHHFSLLMSYIALFIWEEYSVVVG